jgi:hypothetical protein
MFATGARPRAIRRHQLQARDVRAHAHDARSDHTLFSASRERI